MKTTILFLLTITCSQVFAQGRYYPSLKTLLNSTNESIFPPSLKFIESWFKESSEGLFYTNLQTSTSPKNDASFNSLALIPRGKKKVGFYNSGFEISFNENIEKRDALIDVRNNNKFPIYAYSTSFSIQKFDPNDNLSLFYTLNLIFNFTDTEVIAFFLTLYTQPKKKESKLIKLIKDINKANRIKVNKKLFDNPDATLTDLCNEIKKEMPQLSCVYAVYKAYLEAETIEQTRMNLEKFYYRINLYNMQNIINQRMLPSGNFLFIDKTVTLTLPIEHFKYATDSLKMKPVSFLLRDLTYEIDYSYPRNSYEFSVKLYPYHDNSAKDLFEFEHKKYNMLTEKHEIRKIKMVNKQLEYIEVLFYGKTMEIRVSTDGVDGELVPSIYKTLNDITLANE
jgi:hypothetical protein